MLRRQTYFVGLGHSFVKIGESRDPARRIAQLDCPLLPVRPHVYGVLDGRYFPERELHARFAPLRVRGEWFAHKHDLGDFVEQLIDMGLFDAT